MCVNRDQLIKGLLTLYEGALTTCYKLDLQYRVPVRCCQGYSSHSIPHQSPGEWIAAAVRSLYASSAVVL